MLFVRSMVSERAMKVSEWSVCLIEPNKYAANIIVDLLRNAGVTKLAHFTDADEAMAALELKCVNVVIAAVELAPVSGVEWTRVFRRNQKLPCRKAAIFLTSGAFSRAIAEECRHAGANALIGKPISGKTLIATITKVLDQPREFIDAKGYVGPCRRAGIVTAGPSTRRRKADRAGEAEADTPAQKLAKAVAQFAGDKGGVGACVAALDAVHNGAKANGDGPLLRACAALAMQLASPQVGGAETKDALGACADAITQLAQTPVAERELREGLAEQARGAAAKALAHAAAA
jgi:CheY-like chemotaxis protein